MGSAVPRAEALPLRGGWRVAWGMVVVLAGQGIGKGGRVGIMMERCSPG